MPEVTGIMGSVLHGLARLARLLKRDLKKFVQCSKREYRFHEKKMKCELLETIILDYCVTRR
jgi:hypothetical protein